jgi:DNA invertase Pin-like site-specific DNA recombinase
MADLKSQNPNEFVDRLRAMFQVEEGGVDRLEDVATLRYVIYARKSTDDAGKQERSIGDQIRVCQEAAERMGLQVLDIIHEERSAKMSENRPKFRAMLDSLMNDEYDGILTWAPDRLSRNMKEGGEIIDMLDRGDISDIKFANGYYFQNDPAGKMMLGIAFVQAKQFSDQHSQNVRRGMNRITAEGKCYGRPKHGYYKDEKGYLRPDGENWELLKKAFEMRLTSKPHSLNEIAYFLEKGGYPIKTKHSKIRSIRVNEKFVSDVLRDPFYAGGLVFGKVIVNLFEKYDFQPIITPDEFDRLASRDGINKKFTLAEAIKPKGSIKADLLRGMVICGACTRPMSTGITPKKTKEGSTSYFYFRCDTKDCRYKGKSIRAKNVLAAAYEFLDGHPMNLRDGYESYVREMNRLIEARDLELLSKLKSLNKQFEAARSRVDQVKELLNRHKEDEVLAKEFRTDLKEQLKKQADIEKEIQMLQGKREGAKTVIKTYEDFIELFGNLAQHIKKIRNMEDLDFILRKVFMNFVVVDKKIKEITQNSLFRELCGTPFGDGSL